MYRPLHPILEAIVPVVHALGATFGRDCEVVLHDISDLSASVVAIANGHVTNRDIGSPATDFLVSLLERAGTEEDGAASAVGTEAEKDADTPKMHAQRAAEQVTGEVNYRSHTEDGRLLKGTTVLIRDKRGAPIGALCINFDLTHLQVATSALEDLSRIDEHDAVGTEETYPRDATTFLHIMIDQALSRLSKPVALLTKKDNLAVIRELEQSNIFTIKHAVEAVARRLNVSRYTIYNYIDEIRAEHRASAYEATHGTSGNGESTG